MTVEGTDDGSATDDESGSDDESAVTRMVAAVDETWDVHETTEIEEGGNEIFRVTVETPDGTRECVLKTSAGGGGALDAEARVLRLLDGETSVPVPEVYGVVDDHPDLPAPFFLVEHLDGTVLPGDASEISLDELISYVRTAGRHLGDVHSLDAFDGYGPVVAAHRVDPDEAGGTTPLAREYGLTIPEPESEWKPRLAATAESMLERLGGTRFADLVAPIRERTAEQRRRLDLSGSPVLARIDHHPANLVVDPESGAVTGVLDWGIVRTTHPEYELACAEQGFCGLLSLDADRRERLRDALYDGYETEHDRPVDERYAERRRLYQLVFLTANMTWASDWITPDIAAEVERDYRALVDELL